MTRHTIIVFYSQVDKVKYILEYDENYKEVIKKYATNTKIDISLHSLTDTDNTVNSIIKNNPYFTNANKLASIEQLITKMDEIISKNAPSVFDTLLASISN